MDNGKPERALGRGSRLRRRVVTWSPMALVVLIAAAIAGLPVYVRPRLDRLRHADAVFVLGGYEYDRYPYGMSLAAAGWAPNLVISNPHGSNDEWLDGYCRKPHPELTLHCFVPDPNTTRGEAHELRRLATEHGWRTVIVVTFLPQISRARFILSKCFDGDLIMVASPTPVPPLRWIYEYAYQTAGYVRAVLQPSC